MMHQRTWLGATPQPHLHPAEAHDCQWPRSTCHPRPRFHHYLTACTTPQHGHAAWQRLGWPSLAHGPHLPPHDTKHHQRSTTTTRASASASSSSSSSGKGNTRGDVRAMPIKIITITKGNSSGATTLAKEWADKLRRYAPVTEVVIKPNPKRASDPLRQKEAEAEKVLKVIAPGDHVVLCDERGKMVTSEDVAGLIAAAGDSGSPLVFCIGGPFGHGPAVVARANTSISFSRCVLNHAVAHVVLVEQLYRGWTILRGEPYHH